MRTKIAIAGLLIAFSCSALAKSVLAGGDGFNDVVKTIEQFYHVKHRNIPLQSK